MKRKINFSAGPATLPVALLERLRDEMVEYGDAGMSMIESSHRVPLYENLHQHTVALLRELMGIPENYDVLFLGGGATLQFAMVPMNLLIPGGFAEYTLSGIWAKKAFEDAQKLGDARGVADGKDNKYTSLPDPATVKVSTGASYLHITTNETIGGIQWKSFPKTGDVPLVADMSSDILSRKVNVADFGLIYAGAQKNIGPAGVTILIVRKDLLARSQDKLPAYLSYKVHAENDSLYNTPPVFSIYAVHHVLELLKQGGGVPAMEKLNGDKAKVLYDAIDSSKAFYSSPVDKSVRSHMNVVFRLPDETLEKEFLGEAAKLGMEGLKGHRSVGGCRASIYNAMPLAGVQALADLMKSFAGRKG